MARNFRFVARSLWATNANDATQSNALLGDFAVRDVTVNFVTSDAPLQFTPATKTL
jgi:hypothetical protein